MNMRTDSDPATGATYLRLRDAPVARTVHVTDLILVDVDHAGVPVGVEYAVAPGRLSSDELASLLGSFPELRDKLPEPLEEATGEPRPGGLLVTGDVSTLVFTDLRWATPQVDDWYTAVAAGDFSHSR